MVDRLKILCERLVVVRFDFNFLLVIGFDCSFMGTLLYWILQKVYSYDLRSCFYWKSFV